MTSYEFFYTKILNIIVDLGIIQDSSTTKFTIETPRNPNHGDLSSNVAMVYAKLLKKSPIELAEVISIEIKKLPEVTKVEVVKPGFINLFVSQSYWQDSFMNCLQEAEDFGKQNIGKGKKINIEFVSANPTGPLHIGHARGAVIGDILASIYSHLGYAVIREYWINDSGSQVITLGRSLYFRYLELQNKTEQFKKSKEFYPGSYLIPVAQKILAADADKWLDTLEEKWLPHFKKIAIEEMLKLIKVDLEVLGIKHDIFSSELVVANDSAYKKVVTTLQNKNCLYVGKLDAPKGKALDDFKVREQLLFKSTNYGDDEDRALEKSGGERTYFANDVIYHNDKLERGFDKLLNVLGADHIGYLKRITAVVKALSDSKVQLDVVFMQLVNILDNGKPIKMSKRAGNFIILQDLISEVGKDILRFMMITRKHGATIDLDLAKIKEQNNDNPVFYIQYAYARINSVLNNAKKEMEYTNADLLGADVKLLQDSAEIELMKNILKLPRVLELTLAENDPHKIYIFLTDLAKSFHHLWNKGKENNNLRFIVSDNQMLTIARLSLLLQTSIVIKGMLALLGIEIKKEM